MIKSDEREWGDLEVDMIDEFLIMIILVSSVYIPIITYQFIHFGRFIYCMSNMYMYILLDGNETVSSPNIKGHNGTFHYSQKVEIT